MKLERVILCVLFLSVTSWAATHAARKAGGQFREFDFTYGVSLPHLAANAKSFRIWIPVATTTRNQEVRLLNVSGTIPLRITRESEYGNRMAFAEIRRPAFKSAHFTTSPAMNIPSERTASLWRTKSRYKSHQI